MAFLYRGLDHLREFFRHRPVLGTLLVAFGGLIAFISVFSLFGIDNRIIPGPQLRTSQISAIAKRFTAQPGEEIRFFYPTGVFRLGEGFYVFTDRRIIVFDPNVQPAVRDLAFEKIVEIDAEFSDSLWQDSYLFVHMDDETEYWLRISGMAEGVSRFYDVLVHSWEIKGGKRPMDEAREESTVMPL